MTFFLLNHWGRFIGYIVSYIFECYAHDEIALRESSRRIVRNILQTRGVGFSAAVRAKVEPIRV
jgi:hypothetical protein